MHKSYSEVLRASWAYHLALVDAFGASEAHSSRQDERGKSTPHLKELADYLQEARLEWVKHRREERRRNNR